MDDILKGNFKVKNPVELENPKAANDATNPEEAHEAISKELRKRALGCIGGSMVYIDRENLDWNGDDEPQS